MKVCAVCVNFNNSDHTIEYIKSLLPFYDKYLNSIVIVDNNSNQDEVIKLNNFCSTIYFVKIIWNKTNIGYFPAINSGLEILNVKDYDYIIIGNNDLTFDKEFFVKLNLCNYSDEIFVIAPNIIRKDGIHQNPHIAEKFTTLQNLYRRVYFTNYYVALLISSIYNIMRGKLYPLDRVNNDIEHEILMGYGACYILTKFFFKHYRFLDAPVFLMGEEGILANQILEKNGKTIYNPSIIVYHHDHASIGKVGSKKLYEFSKQSYKYYRKYLRNLQ